MFMTAWRRAFELTVEAEVLARLTSIARSRTEPASRVERARMLLAYRKDQAGGDHHHKSDRLGARNQPDARARGAAPAGCRARAGNAAHAIGEADADDGSALRRDQPLAHRAGGPG